MPYCRLYVTFCLLLATINIYDSVSLIEVEAKNIHLEISHLFDTTISNRSSFKQPSTNVTRRRMKSKIFGYQTLSYPCNSTYVKVNGTTCGLREIMIGRCYHYQYVRQRLFLSNPLNIKNCTELYAVFESAVRYKSYCNMNMSTYESYFDLALADIHVINRAMFWSGTYAIAHAYSGSGRNYVTLEDTLAAAMVDGLVWCGKENDTEGFDFVTCPYACKDNKWADYAFWGLASKTFAQLAAGEIYVVLNGSQKSGGPAFRNDSYFSIFELPNLKRNGTYRVTRVNALILHSPDSKVIEKCGQGSLVELERLVRTADFDYSCKDDPEELILIMCSDNWDARECHLARQVLRQTWDKKLHGKSSTNQISLSTIIVLFLLLFNKIV